VLTPIVIFISFVTVMINWFPDLPDGPSMIAYSVSSASIGLGCIFVAAFVYLSQREY
jgi:hypothetical protein